MRKPVLRVRWFAIGVVFAGAMLAQGVATRAPGPKAPTFSKEVAPVLYKNCVTCHRPGAMAPMPLLTYAQVRPYARAIRERVELGTMPPWHAEAPSGTFLNERTLTPTEKDTLVRWVGAGAPEGDPMDMPPAPVFPSGWTIGEPDTVVAMSSPFQVPASGTIAYQYFQIPTNFTEDKWVQAIEIRPGTASVVHHVLLFASDPAGRRQQRPFVQSPARPTASAPAISDPVPVLAAALEARRQAGAAPAPAAAGARGSLIATTAPGTNALTYQPNAALHIAAGSVLTLQVHYTATGKAETDQTSVGFIFSKKPPQQEVHAAAFSNALLAIPPGANNHRVDAQIEFTQNVHIMALFPHTHLRGKSWEYRLTYPDGREEVVLSVPRYDFNWQTYYEYARPLSVPKGSKLLAIAHYDNSGNNKANPDSNAEVHWGEQTWEEMQYSGISYTVD
jgi:Copper type II ascorbate-dependent monooxygenase, C-terminal domain